MNDINSIGNARLIIREVSKVIVGKDESLIKVLLAIIAGGHILMEDIPGVGKTTMAISISKALGLEYGRVQFTPDVLPSDITGYSIFDKESGKMTYQKGAVLCNLFLADELNRATSRTQSALLQALEEGMVTVDNHTYPVPQPFIVIATQNPTGAKGTQMLPDSQMDRFMLRLSMGYPAHDDEIEMIRRKQKGITIDAVQQIESWDEQTLSDAFAKVAADHNIKYGPLMWPSRIAMSGLMATPGGSTDIMYLIGKEETLKRLQAGLDFIQSKLG